MNKIISSGVIVLLIVGAVYIIFLRECKTNICPPKGKVLVDTAAWNAVNSLANKPPEIKRDTVWLPGKSIYVYNNPLPQPKPSLKDSTVNFYLDSLTRKDSISVFVRDSIRGQLLYRSWAFIPLVKQINVEKTIYVPKIVNVFVPIPKNGLFISVLAGGNTNAFVYGGNLDLITKKNTVIGAVYQRWGNDNFYLGKLGIPIRFNK